MHSPCSRRGQSAASAAILVAIIAGFLVLYILFLPPADREQLLFGGGDGTGSGGTAGAGVPGAGVPGAGGSYTGSGGSGVFTQYGPVVMLAAVPGTLRLQRSPTQEHEIPSATIFTAVHTEEIKSIDSAVVKNGVFSSDEADIDFQARKGQSGNYLLSFNVREAGSSPLRISLNGHLLQERPMVPGTPPPISLPADYIVDGTNTLTLSTSSGGLAFWDSNAYFLTGILVSADLVDTSGSVSQQTFSLDENEINAMDKSQLQFVPECDPQRAGRLTIQLNSRLVRDTSSNDTNATLEVPNVLYTGNVDCGVLFQTDVPREDLRLGENRIVFASSGGQYVIDRAKLIVGFKQNDYPIYYFNINPEMYDSVDKGHGALRLTLTFTDYRNDKQGEVVVNGFVQSFETREYAYQALIDPSIITPGPNTIQVIPHADKLDIAELRVELI